MHEHGYQKVSAFKTSDSKYFPSEKEAKGHVKYVGFMKRVNTVLEGYRNTTSITCDDVYNLIDKNYSFITEGDDVEAMTCET